MYHKHLVEPASDCETDKNIWQAAAIASREHMGAVVTAICRSVVFFVFLCSCFLLFVFCVFHLFLHVLFFAYIFKFPHTCCLLVGVSEKPTRECPGSVQGVFRECPGNVPGVSWEAPTDTQGHPQDLHKLLHRGGIHESSDGKQPLCLRIHLKSHPQSDFYLVSQMLNLTTARPWFQNRNIDEHQQLNNIRQAFG